MNAMEANGYTKNYTISGDCSGTASETSGAAIGGATFEGITGVLSATNVTTLNFTNCTPRSITSSGTSYFDTNYVPLGSIGASGTYSVFSPPLNIPVGVTVGNTGNLSSLYRYSDSTKAHQTGRADFMYHVYADTATTAIINMVAIEYDLTNYASVIVVQQSFYRIATTGALVPVSVDMQFPGLHFTLQ
jgi:hypothetical protein